MDKKKKIIITMIIVIIIMIFIILMILFQHQAPKEDDGSEATPPTETIPVALESKLQKVKVRNNYYIVKSCITKFFTYYTSIYDNSSINTNYIDEDIQKQSATAVYNLLDAEYIKENQITEANITTKLKKINESVIDITNMLVSEKNSNLFIYVVEGTLRDKKSGEISDFKVIVKIDALNKTFTILLQDYINNHYKNLAVGNNIEITVPDSIVANTYNTYNYQHITDDIYVQDLLKKYEEEALFNYELAYKSLNEEYKSKRFKNLEDFKSFAKANSAKYVIMDAMQYKKTKTDAYTQYVCVDQNNNYYIFRENSVMDYNLMLDTYTLDLPEFMEEYNKATMMEKVGFNIQKCIEAINNKDYSYIYNKLDDTFKQNKYKTEEVLAKDIQANLFDVNVAGDVSSLHEGNNYIYHVTINSKDDTSKNRKMTFIMQLKEGTDFVMSFSFE